MKLHFNVMILARETLPAIGCPVGGDRPEVQPGKSDPP
jgi:hypothetical protein